MKRFIYKWHRIFAWFMALPLTLWMLSGVLHPMMSNWLKPNISTKFIPAKAISTDSCNLPIGQIFSDLEELHIVKLIELRGQPTLMGIATDQSLHFRSPKSGESIKNGERVYAEQLARNYLDDPNSELVSIEKIEEFDAEYSYINRYLPVYRVVLDRNDGLQVVINPRNGKLASYDDRFRRVATKLFSWFHTWSFLGSRGNWFRVLIISTMSGLAFLISLTGVINLWTMRKAKSKKTRRYHYLMGGSCAILFFTFSLSGFFHSVIKFDYDDSDQWISKQAIPVKSLNHSLEAIEAQAGSIKKLSLASIAGTHYYRVVKADKEESVTMLNSDDLLPLKEGDQKYAEQLALEFSNYKSTDIKSIEKINHFRSDYGFIFRRLPVWRVSFKDKDYWSYTVDTEDAHMSMRIKPISVVEAISFVNLHKFHFLDPLGKSVRDWVLVVSMFLMLTVVVSGVRLLLKRKHRKRA